MTDTLFLTDLKPVFEIERHQCLIEACPHHFQFNGSVPIAISVLLGRVVSMRPAN